MRAALIAMDIRAFNSAIAVLDRIVTEKPDFAEGWNKRATVYYYVDEYDRSLADIERTLALEPRHFGALAGLGMIMQDTGNIRGAIAAFEQAVAVNPSLTTLKQAIEQLNARIGKDI
jgi:tetratricopeptide (TPR) repeat protein